MWHISSPIICVTVASHDIVTPRDNHTWFVPPLLTRNLLATAVAILFLLSVRGLKASLVTDLLYSSDMPLVFDSPPISTATAHLLTFIFAFNYVGSLYVSKHARLSFSQDRANNANGTAYTKLQNERWRDDPSVIKARLLAGSIATILNCGLVFFILWSVVGDRPDVCISIFQGNLLLKRLTAFRSDLGDNRCTTRL